MTCGQSRQEFRKQRKLERRRTQRQQQARDRNPDVAHGGHSESQTAEQQAEYNAQKKQWEDREKVHSAICKARKQVHEMEQAAKEKAQKQWEVTLASMHLLATPSSPSVPPPLESSKGKRKSQLKTFVSADAPPPKRYKDPPRKLLNKAVTDHVTPTNVMDCSVSATDPPTKRHVQPAQGVLDTVNWP